jgi:hypothetical protein
MDIIKGLKRLLAPKRAAQNADKTYKKYFKWLQQHAPNYASGRIELRRVYTSRAGDNYYLPKDLLMLTMERKERIEELQAALDYGLTRAELAGYLHKALEAVKRLPFEFGNKTALQKLQNEVVREISELQFRCNNIKSEDIILEIALVYFFVDGEDPYTLNELTIQRKKANAQVDDNLRSFFLRTTVALLKQATANESGDSEK